MLKQTLLGALSCLILGTSAYAQTVTLDEGSFRILQSGKEVGTETFSIRQNGTGDAAVTIAVGRLILDSDKGQQEINSELQVTGRAMRPAAYEVRVQGAGAQRITGRVVGGRFSSQIVSGSGESMREYLAGDGAVLVDAGVAHHYFFLAHRFDAGSARIPVIIPRENHQVTATVTVAGTERMNFGGQSVEARKLTVQPTGGTSRTVWVDSEGRVLRLDIPSADFSAVRVDAPKQ